MPPDLQFSLQLAEDMPDLAGFYQQCGYQGLVLSQDRVFCARWSGQLVAVIRESQEHGSSSLRGMQVMPDYRGKNLAKRLLEFAASQLSRPCYCLPHRQLQSFYEHIGFSPIAKNELPMSLLPRWQQYEQRGMDLIAMIKR